MKKDLYISYLMLVIDAILSVLVYFIGFKIDKLTSILLILVLILPGIVDIIVMRELYALNENLNKELINPVYRLLSIILVLIAIALGISFFYKTHILLLAFAIIAFTYSNTIRNWGYIRYDKNIFVYKNKTVNLSNIKKVTSDGKIVSITDKDNKVMTLRFRKEENAKKIERILKRI